MRAIVIVVSDRVVAGERPDGSSPAAVAMLRAHGVETVSVEHVPEGAEGVARKLDEAIAAGARVIVTAGGTGVGARNLTPEVTRERIECELTGLEQQVLIEGLKHSEKAGLSRGAIGLTSRGGQAALIINAPSSAGGVRDSLGVVLPLLDSIFEHS